MKQPRGSQGLAVIHVYENERAAKIPLVTGYFGGTLGSRNENGRDSLIAWMDDLENYGPDPVTRGRDIIQPSAQGGGRCRRFVTSNYMLQEGDQVPSSLRPLGCASSCDISEINISQNDETKRWQFRSAS